MKKFEFFVFTFIEIVILSRKSWIQTIGPLLVVFVAIYKYWKCKGIISFYKLRRSDFDNYLSKSRKVANYFVFKNANPRKFGERDSNVILSKEIKKKSLT